MKTPTQLLTPYVRKFGQWLMDISGREEHDVNHAKSEEGNITSKAIDEGRGI